MSSVPPLHPRAESLRIREKLVKGFEAGIVVPEGLAAHGRGEAFDYLLGETTTSQARRAIKAACEMLLSAERPVISVNGNVAALVPDEIVKLSEVTGAKLEVNLFHASGTRERKIAGWLRKHGAPEVLGVESKYSTSSPEIRSNRRKVDKRGIAAADVVFVPLEDGDRTEALKKLGKCVIAIDLNPMSRTAQASDVTIVDNVVRALPLMIGTSKRLSKSEKTNLHGKVKNFDNRKNITKTFRMMLDRLEKSAK